jgi:hypothetical protein
VVAMFVVVDLEIIHIMNSVLVICLCSDLHMPGSCYFSIDNMCQKLYTTFVRSLSYFTLLLTTIAYIRSHCVILWHCVVLCIVCV